MRPDLPEEVRPHCVALLREGSGVRVGRALFVGPSRFVDQTPFARRAARHARAPGRKVSRAGG